MNYRKYSWNKLILLSMAVLLLNVIINQSNAQSSNINSLNISNSTQHSINQNNLEMANKINNWTVISGNWNIFPNGTMHGGIKNNESHSNLNNIALKQLLPLNNEFAITTSYKIKDLDTSGANYASIVFSFENPKNYQYAGINIFNNSTYVLLSKYQNGTLTNIPSWPGIKTDLRWTPDEIFNMTLLKHDSKIDLLINGTIYLSENIEKDNTNNTYIGLNYGRVEDINFSDFNLVTTQNGKSQAYFNSSSEQQSNTNNMHDSLTILLDGTRLPENDYLHIYDSTPYKIISGHLTATLPCNEENQTDVKLLTGSAPELKVTELNFVSRLPTSEQLCSFNANINSDPTNPITDIAIKNNLTGKNDDIDFPSASNIVMGINKFER